MLMALCSMSIRLKFPKVRHIQTEEVEARMEQDPSSVLLLDVRRKEEFDVSHIKGAVWVGDKGEEPQLESALQNFTKPTSHTHAHAEPRRGMVACYCSVGRPVNFLNMF